MFFLAATAATGTAQTVEELHYNLKYGFIKGGEADLIVTRTTFNGNPAIHYYLKGVTTGLADQLFSVYDIYESDVDPESSLPYKSIRNVRERKYRYYNETFFFQKQDSIYSKKTGGMKVPHNLVDILTAFFYLRQHDILKKFDAGQEFSMPVYHSGKYFTMTTVYLGKETIDSKIGKRECHVIAPRVDKGKLLNRSDGLKFYITNDADHVPLLLEFDMVVGSLKCELASHKKHNTELLK
jgi:hypothetical protein